MPRYDEVILCQTIVNKHNVLDKQLHCYTNVNTNEVFFLITSKNETCNYKDEVYRTISEAIEAWNADD